MAIEQTAVNQPQHNALLIQTRVSGLCHSGWHCIEGKFPFLCPPLRGMGWLVSWRRWVTLSCMSSRATTW